MRGDDQQRLFETAAESEDVRPNVREPAPTPSAALYAQRARTLPMWQVTPYTYKGKLAGAPVWLKAGSRGAAERGGRRLLKMFGQKGKFYVSAWPYSPLHDSAFRGYVRAL